MASGSSAKKVARLASKGKGKKVRFQGGTVFPTTMAVVVALGLGLVLYARQSAPSTKTPPTINDHWHISYGFYACDQQLTDLVGTKEDPVDPLFVKYGVHSHGDGVVHWHPSALATGRRAKLGIFLETYGIKMSPEGIEFPADQNDGKDYMVADTKCKNKDGKEVDAQVSAIVWDRYDDESAKKKYITDFDSIRVDKDGIAVMFAFTAPGVDIPMPASAKNLPELGAADTGGVTTTTVAGATTTTVKGATTTTAAATTTTAG